MLQPGRPENGRSRRWLINRRRKKISATKAAIGLAAGCPSTVTRRPRCGTTMGILLLETQQSWNRVASHLHVPKAQACRPHVDLISELEGRGSGDIVRFLQESREATVLTQSNARQMCEPTQDRIRSIATFVRPEGSDAPPCDPTPSRGRPRISLHSAICCNGRRRKRPITQSFPWNQCAHEQTHNAHYPWGLTMQSMPSVSCYTSCLLPPRCICGHTGRRRHVFFHV